MKLKSNTHTFQGSDKQGKIEIESKGKYLNPFPDFPRQKEPCICGMKKLFIMSILKNLKDCRRNI